MSLVTTARLTGPGPCASARQSAATRAVLPLPTGPPTPMRSGPPRARPLQGAPAAPEPWAWGSGSRCKEGHLSEVGGAGVCRAEEVEDWGGAPSENPALGVGGRVPSHVVDARPQRGKDGVHRERVEPEEAYGRR